MKTHSRDGGTPPLSSKNAIKPGPGDMFGTTGTGPGAHGLPGPWPNLAMLARPARPATAAPTWPRPTGQPIKGQCQPYGRRRPGK